MFFEKATNQDVELKATEDGYSLYKSIGFRDFVSKYHQMEWRNERTGK